MRINTFSGPVRTSLALTLLTVSLCCVLNAVSCSTTHDIQRVDEMTEAEFDRFMTRVSSQIGAIATAAVEEGDITTGALQSPSLAITGALDGGLGVLWGIDTDQ